MGNVFNQTREPITRSELPAQPGKKKLATLRQQNSAPTVGVHELHFWTPITIAGGDCLVGAPARACRSISTAEADMRRSIPAFEVGQLHSLRAGLPPFALTRYGAAASRVRSHTYKLLIKCMFLWAQRSDCRWEKLYSTSMRLDLWAAAN